MLSFPFCPLGLFGITFVRIKKSFLSVLLTVWCFIWIGNCISFLSFFFFFPQPLLWLHLLKLGVEEREKCDLHWWNLLLNSLVLCEVKLSIYICLMTGMEYEYMPQDWDFSISHLDLLIFWIIRSSSLQFLFVFGFHLVPLLPRT